MRDFEERKAEIFRRSDERIKERKRNRRRILMTCVPIVLFAGILTLSFVHNALLMKEGSDGIDEWNDTVQINEVSLVYPITVEMKDLESGEIREIEECYNIAGVTDIILSVTEGRERLYKYGISTESDASHQKNRTKNAGSYVITITREEETGEEKTNVYILKKDMLIDESTRNEYQLSGDELDELLAVLGLTD